MKNKVKNIINISAHNSLNKNSLFVVFLITLLLFIIFSFLWLSIGAWPISIFMGVEYLTLCFLFFLFYKKRKIKEDLEVNEKKIIYRLYVEKKLKIYLTFNTYWTKIIFWKKENKSELILTESGKRVEVGKLLHAQPKEEIYNNINNYLSK